MQEVIGLTVISMIIGGIIGGGTNRLAIAMLFRPHRAVRIGKWVLPFTPGLIPKRRHELALQLGRTVREYLVNGEALNRTIHNESVRDHIVAWAINEWERIRENQRVQKWVTHLIRMEEERLERDVRLRDWFSQRAERELKQKVVDWAPAVNDALIRFLGSDEGYDMLRNIYGNWTRTQGWVGRLTGTLLDETRMAEKSSEWFIAALDSPHGLDTTRRLLSQGMDVVLNWRIRDVIAWAGRQLVNESAKNDEGVATLIERIVPHLLDSLALHVEEWLDLLQLDQLVAQQIETFSLPKLEEMIVRVAKKELRLITWIGVLIGAIIGLCQGLISTLFY